MRTAFAALAIGAALSVSACTTTGLDSTIRDNLPQACSLLNQAHVAFNLVAATGQVPAATVRRENAAYEGVAVFCDDPSHVTAANALVLVAGAYAIVTVALRDAEALS